MGPWHSARGGSAVRRRWPWQAAAAIFIVALVAPAAGSAAPLVPRRVSGSQPSPAGNSPAQLAALEARAARLSRQYRGELVMLTDAQSAAKTAMARVLPLRRQLSHVQQELAALAAASYMDGVQDPAMVILSGANTQRMLEESATLQYVAGQRSARQAALMRFLVTEQRAEQAALTKTTQLRRLIAALAGRRRRVDALLARFHPQSPVIGDNITPRMRQVKDAIDQRFGPFVDIGCYRPETTGEHPLGRACDFMLSTGGVMPTASNIARGYAIAAWAQANASRLGIMYIIYRQKMWDIRMASAGWLPMADRGSITANHYDHVHISVF